MNLLTRIVTKLEDHYYGQPYLREERRKRRTTRGFVYEFCTPSDRQSGASYRFRRWLYATTGIDPMDNLRRLKLKLKPRRSMSTT